MGHGWTPAFRSLFSLFVLGLSLLETTASAREDLVPGSRYTSAQGAAMGDAVLPLGYDGSALFYNPANLAKVRGSHLDVFDFSAYGSPDYFGMLNRNFYKQTSLSSYEPTLQSHPGKFASTGAALYPNFYRNGFGFGMLIQSQIGASESATNMVHYRSTYQIIPTAGGAVKLAGGIIRLGYSVQWVNEAVGDIQTQNTATPLGYNQGLQQGNALSHTIGAAMTLPIQYLPQLNIVARNVGNAKYGSWSLYSMSPNPTGKPKDEAMSIDASLSFQPKSTGGGFYNLVAEVRDLTASSAAPLFSRLALGVEYSYRDKIFLRGGFSDRYPAAGVALRHGASEFGLTWYSEELGTAPLTLRDTRYLAHWQVAVF